MRKFLLGFTAGAVVFGALTLAQTSTDLSVLPDPSIAPDASGTDWVNPTLLVSKDLTWQEVILDNGFDDRKFLQAKEAHEKDLNDLVSKYAALYDSCK